MSLFNFGKKKEEKNAPACSCGCSCAEANTAVDSTEVFEAENENGLKSVKVLGSGCKSCHALLENAKKAVDDMGLSVDVEYVTDMKKVMEYGVMSMPALVVNEKVVSMGKVLKASEVETIFQKFQS